jgi:hypothetical protein
MLNLPPLIRSIIYKQPTVPTSIPHTYTHHLHVELKLTTTPHQASFRIN